ncbi:MAG: glutaminase A [Leptolyngbya sp. SIO3F4]|nr:glutaminase A [Leptolyngbya sp. SIO3F4]
MVTTEQIETEEASSLFRLLDRDHQDKVTIERLWKRLAENGILRDDPRLHELEGKLEPKTSKQVEDGAIDDLEFKEIICHNALVKKAIAQELTIPDFADFCREIKGLYEETKKNKGGKVADYIPQLARINPEQYAISICTVDGQRYSLGDANKNFCLQSSCKPINYCLALEELGEKKVHEHVGREPSGQSFNELTLNSRGLPHNPMINAGAIMSSSLIDRKADIADRFDLVSKTWSMLCGNRDVHFNNSVYLSERQTADRNFALAYFMRENNAFPENTDLTETLEFYFQCCSIESCTSDLSIAAATLANAGMNPLTGDRIFQSSTIQNCLSLMLSCGMYDFSGEFSFKIGLPAKSGVSGALMIVIPNVMGISIWSPRLDTHGNSVRGVEFCTKLVEKFSFHHYDSLNELSGKINPRKKQKAAEVSKMVGLIWSASNGDMDELHRLESEGISLDLADYDGRTPLHLAVCENQVEVIDYLLMHCENLEPKDRWGNTPLKDAENAGHKEIAQKLRTAIRSKKSKNGKKTKVAEVAA